jgi:DNA-3-methyladenine glycosylase I
MPVTRCSWAGTDPRMIAYHDDEWGRPVHDDRVLFEFLILEGAQAGLSWSTILNKREAYRKAYKGFDPRKVARFDASDRKRLLADAGIVRNRAKVRASIDNARAFLEVAKEHESFDRYLWSFVSGKPVVNRHRTHATIPAKTPLAESISKDLRQRGFRFVGPTIVYAFLQAVGVVDDHLTSCFRRRSK